MFEDAKVTVNLEELDHLRMLVKDSDKQDVVIKEMFKLNCSEGPIEVTIDKDRIEALICQHVEEMLQRVTFPGDVKFTYSRASLLVAEDHEVMEEKEPLPIITCNNCRHRPVEECPYGNCLDNDKWKGDTTTQKYTKMLVELHDAEDMPYEVKLTYNETLDKFVGFDAYTQEEVVRG